MSTTPAAAPANADTGFTSPLPFGSLVSDYGLIGIVGVAALLLALVLAPLVGGYPSGIFYLHDVSLSAIRALVCVAALCGASARRQGTPPGDSASSRLATALPWLVFLMAIASLLVHSRLLTDSVLLYAMLPATLDWLCYALAFTLALLWAGRDRRIALLIVGAVLVGAAGTAVLTVQQYGGQAQAGFRDFRAQGPFFSPNFACGLLALTIPGLAAWCIAARERLGALVTGAAASIAFGALVSTGSRSGIGIEGIGLLSALILSVIAYPRQKDGPVFHWLRLGALAAAFLVMGFAFRGPLASRAAGSTGTDEHSGAFRTLTWKGTLVMAKANPVLGTGPGTFGVRYPHYALIERTDLAHSSYLQVAAEEGFLAVAAAAAAIATSAFLGLAGLMRRRGEGDAWTRLLLSGMIGGLIAGSLRSLFDSEWSLLGNGLPFWTVAGLLPALAGLSAPAVSPLKGSVPRTAWLLRGAGGCGLVVALILFYGAQSRDATVAEVRSSKQATNASPGWPPDPTVLAMSGKPDIAAVIEPSGRRLYQLATYQANVQNDMPAALRTLKAALDADPNSLQTWRRLAESEEASGDHTAAITAWTELIHRFEGPAGKVRAIPEIQETYPAFAYAALGDDALTHRDNAGAAAQYARAAAVAEDYSRTTPEYQRMEMASASVTGSDVMGRRQELRDLYEHIITQWTKAEPQRSAELDTRRKETLERLDKFVKPEDLTSSTGS